jgi:hypothetical protein
LQLVQFLLKAAIVLLEIGRGTAFSPGPGRAKGPDLGDEGAYLFLAELPVPGRHPSPLAVENADHQLRIGPLLLPGAAGEVRNRRLAVTARAATSVLAVATRTVSPKQSGAASPRSTLLWIRRFPLVRSGGKRWGRGHESERDCQQTKEAGRKVGKDHDWLHPK